MGNHRRLDRLAGIDEEIARRELHALRTQHDEIAVIRRHGERLRKGAYWGGERLDKPAGCP